MSLSLVLGTVSLTSLLMPPATSCGGKPGWWLTPSGEAALSAVRFVRMGSNASGVLVAVWSTYGAPTSLRIASSSDGKTWSLPHELDVVAEEDFTFGAFDFTPSVAADGSERFLAVWSGRSDIEHRPHLKFSMSSDAGASWSASGDLPVDIPASIERDELPFVLGLRDGGFIVAWERTGSFFEDSSHGTRVAYTRTASAGDSWSQPAYLNVPNDYLQEMNPQLVELPDSSVLAISSVAGTFREPGNGGFFLSLSRIVDGGAPRQALLYVSGGLEPNTQFSVNPAFAMDASGRIALTWDSGYDYSVTDPRVYLSTSDDQGVSWTAPMMITGCEPGQLRCREGLPQIHALDAGGFALAWQRFPDNHNSGEVSEMSAEVSFSKDGQNWSVPCAVDLPYALSEPRLSSLADGTPLLYAIAIAAGYPVALVELSEGGQNPVEGWPVSCGRIDMLFCALMLSSTLFLKLRSAKCPSSRR